MASARVRPPTAFPDPPRDPRLLRAMRFVEANIAAPLTGKAIAAVAGLSPHHFLRLYVQETGETIGDHVRRSRLDAAAQRLAWTRQPVVEIAGDVGYQGQASFTRAFRQWTGVTPARYRRARQGTPLGRETTAPRIVAFPALRCVTRRYVGRLAEAPAFWKDFDGRLPPGYRDPGKRRIAMLRSAIDFGDDETVRYDCACALDAGDRHEDGSLQHRGLEIMSISRRSLVPFRADAIVRNHADTAEQRSSEFGPADLILADDIVFAWIGTSPDAYSGRGEMMLSVKSR